MGNLVNFISELHMSTKRNYLDRMINNKVECMNISKKYDQEYWDGERRYGYGGYSYIPGRWKPVAEKIIDLYNLNNTSNILDRFPAKLHHTQKKENDKCFFSLSLELYTFEMGGDFD